MTFYPGRRVSKISAAGAVACAMLFVSATGAFANGAPVCDDDVCSTPTPSSPAGPTPTPTPDPTASAGPDDPSTEGVLYGPPAADGERLDGPSSDAQTVGVVPPIGESIEVSTPHGGASSVDQCPPDVYYGTPKREGGFNGTSATSYQVGGPATITDTETDSTAQAFGVKADVKVSASAIITSAEATFGVSYTKTLTVSKAWSYSTAIPAHKTGLMAVLHLEDRVSTIKYTDKPNCKTNQETFYSYVPRDRKKNVDFCIIRDLEPYGYNNWRSRCAGE